MKDTDLRTVVMEAVDRVDSLINDELELVRASNLRDELGGLRELLTKVRGAFYQKDRTLFSFPDPMGRRENSSWLIKLKEVVYKAEDVLDELTYEILRPKVTLLNFLQTLISKHKFSNKLKILNRLLASNNLDAIKYQDRIIPRSLITDSVLDNLIIGREADVSKIVNLLTRSSDQQVLTVVPIVGMRGLGKTALAKLVSQRVMVSNLFDAQVWVCVSDKCDGQEVFEEMLLSLNAIMGGLSLLTNKDAIFRQLEKQLEGKRFLLVLDDVWEHVSGWWDEFRTHLLKFFKHGEVVVLVTTRSEETTSIVETSSQHRHTLDLLSDDDCWFILKEMAFRNLRMQPDLEAIGQEIAKICRGVPLAAKVLGGTLGFKTVRREWLEIRESHVSEAGNDEENVERILQLCFSYLPSPLKECFAICSVFPKEFFIMKEDLIRMWMAERLVDFYDTGNDSFHALLVISFFKDVDCDNDGNVIKCKILNIELEIRPPESFVYVDYQSIRTSKVLPKNKSTHLSTIILNGAPFPRSWNSKRLRTLYLNDVDMKKLPSTIRKLRSLRYLHVSNTKTRPLPESINQIYMLQILTLSNCSCEKLPFLGYLPRLKFLTVSHMKRVKCIGNESYRRRSSRHELRLFPALKSLSLSWMENLIEWSPNMAIIFPRLQSLSIQCCPKFTGFPMEDLRTLVKIDIKDCDEFRFIFDEHKPFRFVKRLSIVRCPKLTYLRSWLLSNEYYEEFRVKRCGWLKFIPEDLGLQKYLISLQIYCCEGLEFFPEEILSGLTQLRKLSIGAFSKKLDDFSYLNRIRDLEELEIWGSDVFGRKMSAQPNQLQHLDGLQSLKIKGFTAMEALPEWFPNLRSLKTISLNYCWHLEYQSTAAIIQRLPKLSHIYISDCHAIEEHKSQWMEFSGATNIRFICQ